MTLIYRVRVASTGWSGSPGLNTFYFQGAFNPSDSSSEHALAVATVVHDQFEAEAAIFPTSSAFQVDGVVDVLTAETGELFHSWGITAPDIVNGSSGSAYGPIAAMICVSVLTDTVVAGHRVRGRVFLGPLKVDADADGSPASSSLETARLLVDGLLSFGDELMVYGVWHRPKAGTGGAFAKATAATVKDTYAVLRSRRD